MRRDFGKEHLTKLVKSAKIALATATRIKQQSTSVGIDVLDKLAVAFKVQPWHLLIPYLDVNNVPSESSLAPPQWPFEHVSQADYEALSMSERIIVQARLQGYLERVIEEKNRGAQASRKVA